MRKENVLVAVLVVMIAGAVFGYNFQHSESVKGHAGVQHQNDNLDQEGKKTVQHVKLAVFDPIPAANAATIDSGGIQWKDYTPGLAQARQENKSVFLYFYAPWCTYCTKLKQTTFKDERVLSYLHDKFISIQVNTDIDKVLAQEWQVRGLPTLWFLEADGKKIDRLPGYVSADQLLKILEYIHTKSYNDMTFREFAQKKE